MKKTMKSLITGCLLLALPTVSGAATVSYSTSISYSFSNVFSSLDPIGSTIFIDDIPVTGLQRFDPALGTLNSISVNVITEMDLTADLYDNSVNIGPASIEATGLLNFQPELIVWDSGTGTGSPTLSFSPLFNTDTVFCEDLFGYGCSESVLDLVNVDVTGDITNASSLNLADFTGTGLIDPGTLTFGVAYPESIDFFILSGLVDEAILDVYIDAAWSGVDVTITYDYSPVPLPGALWLMLSGLGLLLGIRRRR